MKAISALIVASALLASPAFAEYGSDRGSMKHGSMMKHCDEMDDCITEGLNLTPDQQPKVRTILEDARKKRENLRNETMQKMRAVLKPAQVKMVDAHRAEIMEYRAEQMKKKAERMEDRAEEMKDRQEDRR